MTPDEYIKKLQRVVTNIKLFQRPLVLAASSTMAQMGQRIFDDGKKTDGSDIGEYSTEPIYVSLKANPKPTGEPIGKPKGKAKRGESVFKTGKKAGQKHTSKYFPEGYKGYRANIGRTTDKVNLSLTNELRLDFSNQNTNKPHELAPLQYAILLKKPINQDKRAGNEERFGEIFTISKSEEDKFIELAQKEFTLGLRTALKI